MAFEDAQVSRGNVWVMWGLALLMIDIPFRRWNIPPDFFGWILMAIGLGQLRPIGPRIQWAQWISFAMIALSLTELFGVQRDLYRVAGEMVRVDVLFPLPQAVLIAVVLLLLNTIIELANNLGHTDLSHDAGVRRNLFLVWYLPYAAAILVGPFFPMLYKVLLVIAWVYSIVVLVLLIQLLRRAAEELMQAQGTAGARPSR